MCAAGRPSGARSARLAGICWERRAVPQFEINNKSFLLDLYHFSKFVFNLFTAPSTR